MDFSWNDLEILLNVTRRSILFKGSFMMGLLLSDTCARGETHLPKVIDFVEKGTHEGLCLNYFDQMSWPSHYYHLSLVSKSPKHKRRLQNPY